MAKWVRLDPETLDEIYTAMAQLWAEEGDGTLWNLNCLIYAGARVMINRAKGACKSTHPDGSQTNTDPNPEMDADNSDSDSDGSDEGLCDLLDFEPLEDPTETPGEPMDVDPANPTQPIRKRRETVREIRRSV